MRTCSNCGKTSETVRACCGICGGATAYCSRECLATDYKKGGHKRVCWKRAANRTLTLPNPKGPNHPEIPLQAHHQLDGFGRSGVSLYYSDHLGEERTRPHVVDYFGQVDDEMGWNASGLATLPWCIVTSPVHDPHDRATLKFGETVCNII